MTERFRIYVSSISYYSGKFEAYVRYIGLPHDRVELSTATFPEILKHTGIKKMPAAQCPDGRWLKDTTPMIRYLDREYADLSIYPDDSVEEFLSLMLEDYADEWLWRPAMHYRWSFPESRAHLARRIERLFLRLPLLLKPLGRMYISWRQRSLYIRGDGVRRSNRSAIEAIYQHALRRLDGILQQQEFLGGARPSIVDFGFFASMFRHFALDPDSAAIMQDEAPSVFAWTARLWAAHANGDDKRTFASVAAPHWREVWQDMGTSYLPYLDQNAAAWQNGQKRFNAVVDGVGYPAIPTVHYRVACREQLLKAWQALSSEDKERVRTVLASSGVPDWLEAASVIKSGLDQEFEMPLAPRYREPSGLYGLKTLHGTPWDMHDDAIKR